MIILLPGETQQLVNSIEEIPNKEPRMGTGCVCYIAGPASRLCPLHETTIEIDQQQLHFNNSLTELLENLQENSINNNVEVMEIVTDETENEHPGPINENTLNNTGIQLQNNNIFLNRPIGMVNYLQATNRHNIEIHHCGQLQEICPHCQAKYFRLEKTSNGKYSQCCQNGKVRLPHYQLYPDELRRLFSGEHELSRQFKNNVIAYNNCFRFISVQANLRNFHNRGPYVYSIYGEVYHHYTDINVNRDEYKYGPIYFLDENIAIQQRIRNMVNINVNPQLIQLIENVLRNTNPYAQQYRFLGHMYEQQVITMNNEQRFQIPRVYLEFMGRRRDINRRENDLPEVQEVAAVVQYDENIAPNPKMRVFLTERDGGFRIIEHQSPHSDPLTYPLLFPNGDQGWNTEIPFENVQREGGRKRVTLCQYYSYRFAYRNDENFNILQFAGRLNQQFIVSAFIKIEANRINYIRQNQNKLRANEYNGLVDYLQNLGERENIPIGRMIILPSSYQMSPRNQMQRFQDAMAVVSKLGCPSLFITFTCNPKWTEINENIPAGDEASNHPLLICRIFQMKLKELMNDLTKKHVMGVCIAHLYVIEFQKRGLPHAHILITLRNEDKFLDIERVDQLICAEIPNFETEPELCQLVGQHMIHGPCGIYNPTSVCMEDNKCTKNFPKFWYNHTTMSEGKINYQRRRNDRSIEVRRNNIRYNADNSFVVPYNPFLLIKYRTHINVEACNNTAAVKYLYKYFFKGTDNITMQIVQRQENNDLRENEHEPRNIQHDEIKSYLNGRYLTPPECSWHILKLDMHGNSHHVERLQIHLPGRQNILFQDGQEELALNAHNRSQLLNWFEINNTDEQAKQLLYTEFPIHYVWRNNRWHKRQRTRKPIIPRLVNVSIRNGELYYLRLLLLHVRGATSFEYLRTVNNTLCETFQEACQQRNLLAEDREWFRSLNEASTKDMPKQLRQMFAFILVFGVVDNVPALWEQFQHFLIEDHIRRHKMNERDAVTLALQKIQSILMVNGRRLSDFGINDPPEINANEEHVNIEEEQRDANTMIAQLNNEQRAIYDIIINAIEDNETQRLFFITGHAGTGKTFLYNTILTSRIARNERVLSISSTGLAAAILKQGKTVHSSFQLPIPVHENSSSYITRQSDTAQNIRETKLIVWDEVSMSTRLIFELVDRTLRFLCNTDVPFGGKCVIIGGDFKQCLPILQNVDRASILQACIKNSRLWNNFRQFELQTNMRVRPEEQTFIAWLNQLGNNTLPTLDDTHNLIEIPDECIVDSLENLIRNVFGNLQTGDVPNKAILTPLNNDCDNINDRILDIMQNAQEIIYSSIDEIVSENPDDVNIYPIEFLNSLKPSGLPQYKLRLKEGCIVMLIRNLNVRANLCNGTRLLVRQLGQHYIDAQIIQFDGQLSEQRVFIPRIDFITNRTSNLPFILKRRQFPIKVSYCLTINKAQGQSYDTIGIYLPNVVFQHGQLYVAFSRARTMQQVFVCALNTIHQGKFTNNKTYTKNIVYEEIL